MLGLLELLEGGKRWHYEGGAETARANSCHVGDAGCRALPGLFAEASSMFGPAACSGSARCGAAKRLPLVTPASAAPWQASIPCTLVACSMQDTAPAAPQLVIFKAPKGEH